MPESICWEFSWIMSFRSTISQTVLLMKEFLKFVYIFLTPTQVKARKCHNLGFCPSTEIIIKTVVNSRSLRYLFLWLERKTVKEGAQNFILKKKKLC